MEAVSDDTDGLLTPDVQRERLRTLLWLLMLLLWLMMLLRLQLYMLLLLWLLILLWLLLLLRSWHHRDVLRDSPGRGHDLEDLDHTQAIPRQYTPPTDALSARSACIVWVVGM